MNTESTGASAAATAALILAALIALAGRRRWLLLGVAVLVIAFAFLDIREALHQHDEARTNLVLAAAALAAAHAAAGVLALVAYRVDRAGRPLTTRI
jgi:hypothetical protein